MKIPYFQRYHGPENVATANTMLLLSRLYTYSSDKFFKLLKSFYPDDSFEPEISFKLQERAQNSIPDATITQESFKIVIETKKTSRLFDDDQLLRHLNAFHNEKYKVLLTLAKDIMSQDRQTSFEEQLSEYNRNNQQTTPVVHINTTFEAIANAVREQLDDRDYEMKDILEDYRNYCSDDGLISRKYMRVQLSSKTLAYNMAHNVYSDRAERGFSAHDFLGLYDQKSVRAIGKIVARITAVTNDNGEVDFQEEYGQLTDERENTIRGIIQEWNLREEHRYFFVDQFHDTDFRKISSGAPRGSRILDLTQVLGTDDIPTDTQTLAQRLRDKTWT